MSEICANCDRKIGRLETPRLWGETIVCFECYGRLSKSLPAEVEQQSAAYDSVGPTEIIEAQAGELPVDYVDFSPSESTPMQQQFVLQNVVHIHDYANRGSGVNPGIAAILSFLIPGVGQMYLGKVGEGVFWLVAVILGYFFFIFPGLIIHLASVIGAACYKPPKKRRRY